MHATRRRDLPTPIRDSVRRETTPDGVTVSVRTRDGVCVDVRLDPADVVNMVRELRSCGVSLPVAPVPDDPADALEPTTTLPEERRVAATCESADDDGPDIILGHDLGENGGA